MSPIYEHLERDIEREFKMSYNKGAGSIRMNLLPKPKKLYRPSDFPSPFTSDWKENPYNFIKWKGSYSPIIHGLAFLIGMSQKGTAYGYHRPGKSVRSDKFLAIYLNPVFAPNELHREGLADIVRLSHRRQLHVIKDHHNGIGFRLNQDGANWAYTELKKAGKI